jgi:hypothetical protein
MENQAIDMTTPLRVERRKILLVANETLEGAALRDVTARRGASEHPAEVLVIAPALNSRLGHWLSDVDEARRSAGLRLTASLEQLSAAGIEAEGMVGDADPLQAIADALHLFGAQEIVIASDSEDRAHWLTRDLGARARQRFTQPVIDLIPEPVLRSKPRSNPGAGGGRSWRLKRAARLHAHNTRALAPRLSGTAENPALVAPRERPRRASRPRPRK